MIKGSTSSAKYIFRQREKVEIFSDQPMGRTVYKLQKVKRIFGSSPLALGFPFPLAFPLPSHLSQRITFPLP